MNIEEQLNIKFPIYWDIWAIEEEFARFLSHHIVTQRPRKIVELGSGTSTLIMVKTLEKLGYDYSLVSIDSSLEFLTDTKNLLISEGVYDEKKIKLVHAPIKDTIVGSGVYKWYQRDLVENSVESIDFLFIDGPFGGLCKNSRYPGLPLLKRFFNEDRATIVMHDSKREDEKEIVDIWKRENPEIENIFNIETKRGGVKIIF